MAVGAVLLTAPMVVAQNGSLITFAGLVRDDGCPDCCCEFSCQNIPCDPPEFDEQGRQIFRTSGRGRLVIEVMANLAGSGRQSSNQGTLVPDPDGGVFEANITDFSGRPGVQVAFEYALGAAVPQRELVDCDNFTNLPPRGAAGRGPSGGVPAVAPTFPPGDTVTAALVDIACRFHFFASSGGGCTTGANGEFAFVHPFSRTQYCLDIPQAALVPFGKTVVAVKVCDDKFGTCELGPPVEIVLLRGDGGG